MPNTIHLVFIAWRARDDDDDDDRFYSLQEVSQTYETRVSYKDTSTKSIQNVQNRML